MITIYQKSSKLIKNLLLIAVMVPAFALAKSDFTMQNPKGQKITLRLALTRDEHSKGLSGLKQKQFSNNDGMLFVNDGIGTRRFWMPDTYFNINIIFLDQDFGIVDLERNVPAHPGLIEPPVIYRTKSYQAQYILETNAKAPFSKDLKAGDKLKWMNKTPISEIILKTRQRL
ncbi:MAG: DUF192 domain-containing protein [Bacteriovorax sp.]|nr:DUF192 domain-containing protein [Bacteriovorax sp.]